MSVYHIPEARNGLSPDQCTVRKMLVENEQLIETISSYQNRGRIEEATKYQELLHRNLILLAKLADTTKQNFSYTQMSRKASPGHTTIRRLLVENGQLIETISGYQRIGKLDEVPKYMELLHKNIAYLARFGDDDLAAQLQQDLNGSGVTDTSPNQQHIPPPLGGAPVNMAAYQQQKPQTIVPGSQQQQQQLQANQPQMISGGAYTSQTAQQQNPLPYQAVPLQPHNINPPQVSQHQHPPPPSSFSAADPNNQNNQTPSE